MQKSIKVNESQLLLLAERANGDSKIQGPLWKKSTTAEKWQLRFFVLYQNLLFYYENKDKKDRPLGIIFLEGSYIERVIYGDLTLLPHTPEKSKEKSEKTDKEKENVDRNLSFQISFGKECVRKFELCGIGETETLLWIQELEKASFSKQHLEMQKVTAKHLHIIQVVEAEQTAKWQFSLHCEDLYAEMRFLREELATMKRQRNVDRFATNMIHTCMNVEESACLCCLYEDLQGDEEKLAKLRKVQSFFRGWLCRRKWKQIVEQYIKSPHAERLRKRNNVVFQLVEAEEEYIQQMEVLITCFLRPFKMAASSKKPPCTHDDVNSIFLNSDSVFFLHQIFLKGLTARLESWPTLVLGDLFSMLLPMLNIYQEYVRNHHYSLQVLTECKQNQPFAATLKRLESKPMCNGRSLETFLTYPMHQIPRYIITLHELLAHTPFEHVERKSLEAAQVQLENLSKQMHDEVSATENLRKNLAIERMIVEGCDILLDVKQIFVRQGTLIQIPSERQKEKITFKGFKSLSRTDKEVVRQCFLFSYHLIVTNRASDGNLHLVPNFGKIPMSDSILIEEPNEESGLDRSFGSTCSVTAEINPSYQGRDFKIIIDSKTLEIPMIIHFVAPTVNEKAAWISDIAGCIDNAQFNEICKPIMADTSSINLPQYIRNDPRLFHDEPDIRFSKTLNSCKIPQIRYATPDRLLERLTDLRFLSIDFLNTFLLTYKVFTDGIKVLTALKRVYYASVEKEKERMAVDEYLQGKEENFLQIYEDYRRRSSLLQFPPRRTSGASSVSGYCSEASDRDRSFSYDFQQRAFRNVISRYEDDSSRRPSNSLTTLERKRSAPKTIFIKVNSYEESFEEEQKESNFLPIPKVEASSSSDTLTDLGPDPCGSCGQDIPIGKLTVEQRRRRDILEEKRTERRKSEDRRKSDSAQQDSPLVVPKEIRRKSDISAERKKSVLSEDARKILTDTKKYETEKCRLDEWRRIELIEKRRVTESPRKLSLEERKRASITNEERKRTAIQGEERKRSSVDSGSVLKISEERRKSGEDERKKNIYRHISSPRPERKMEKERSLSVESDTHPEERVIEDSIDLEDKTDDVARSSIASVQASTQVILEFFQNFYQRSQKEGEKREPQSSRSTTARSSFQHESVTKAPSKAGVVVGGIKQAKRRSSSSYASTAFAIATCAADNPVALHYQQKQSIVESKTKPLEQIISTAATMRVLNVLRHWISKQGKDFEADSELKRQTKEFLEEIRCNPNLTSTEHKSAAQLLLLLEKQDEEDKSLVDLVKLLSPPMEPSRERIESLSALEIAEQLTYIDHQIFMQIAPEELMGHAWMKPNKEERAPHIVMMTKRFNDVSRLIASEIVRKTDIVARAETIEKWAAVADIVRCLHNFNGVLQICSAFTNVAVFRLKNTWEKVSKTAKQSIEKHQKIVSSDGRFRALRDALHKCDPPCIPYLGVYLTDLSFIEEGTPNFVDDNLLNFSKMRMIAHIIREIRQYQHTSYKIDLVTRVSNYLLDTSLMMDDDQLYAASLKIEPRQARLTSQSSIGGPTPW
ncbi:hypothetical protein ABEB36_011238 [Hypothenemus hampei]|uniref:Ras-specific guanine nucleotide-releasing factor 2-like n=1 Tax=Hypothenemus hampei TaxID=57062 RepID=A0ABD1EGP7_HYPHA